MKKFFFPLLFVVLLFGCIPQKTVEKQPAVSSLEAELQKLREAGIPTTVEELNLQEIPDQENGSLVFREVFKIIDGLYQQHKEEWEYFPAEGSIKWENVPETKKKQVMDLILHNPEFIRMYQLLDEASLIKSGSLTRDDLQKWISEFPDGTLSFSLLPKMRRCARLLCAKATIESDCGSIDNALNACITGLRLGKSISDEPFLISQMVRMALDAIATASLEKIIQKGDGDSKLYQALIDEIKTEISASMIKHGMPGDLIINDLPRFSYWRKQGEEMFIFNEDDRKTLETIKEHFKDMPGDNTQRIAVTEKRLQEKRTALKEAYLKSGYETPQVFVDMQEVFYLDKILTVFNLTRSPLWEARKETQKIDDEIRKAPKEEAILSHEILLPENTSMFTGWFKQEARTKACLGAAEIGLANRIYRQKHGKFVSSLRQLTPEIMPALPLDPFTGKNYIYRKKDKGFIVYSVADNLKDDGGFSQNEKNGWQDDFDIVWEDNGAISAR